MSKLGIYRRVLGTAGTQALTTGLGLISGILIARTLGADGRGYITAVMVYLTVLSWLVFLGLPNAAGYISRKGRSPIVSLSVVMTTACGVVAGIVLWILVPTVAADYPQVTQNGLRVTAAILPFVGIASCGQEILYAETRIGFWNILRSIPLAGPSISVMILAALHRLTVASAIIVNLSAMVVYILLALGVVLTRVSTGVEWTATGQIWRYAFPRWMSASSDAITARLDQVLMVGLSTPSELGRYAVAVTAVSVSTPLSAAVGLMMYPDSRNTSTAKESEDLHKIARRRSVMLSTLSGIVVVGAAAPLLGILFGPDFRGLESILVLLVLAQIFDDRYVVDIGYFAGIGDPKVLIGPSWATAGCAVIGLLIFGRNGLTGFEAALITLICAAVRCASISIASKRHRDAAARVR